MYAVYSAAYRAVYMAYTATVSIVNWISEWFYFLRDSLWLFLEPLLRIMPGWVTPDRLSWSRVPLGIIVTLLLFIWICPKVALALYVFAWVTDILDGALADFRQQFSVFGKLIDPVADKVMNDLIFAGHIYSGMPGISDVTPSLWMIIAFDIATASLAGLLSYFYSGLNIKSNWCGKLKYGFQCAGGMPLIMGNVALAAPILQIAAVLGVMSFIGYSYKGIKEIRK